MVRDVGHCSLWAVGVWACSIDIYVGCAWCLADCRLNVLRVTWWVVRIVGFEDADEMFVAVAVLARRKRWTCNWWRSTDGVWDRHCQLCLFRLGNLLAVIYCCCIVGCKRRELGNDKNEERNNFHVYRKCWEALKSSYHCRTSVTQRSSWCHREVMAGGVPPTELASGQTRENSVAVDGLFTQSWKKCSTILPIYSKQMRFVL